MKQNIASTVQKELSGVIEDLGYELYDVEYVKKNNGMNLTIYIQKSGADITIDDCEKVHRVVDKVLDELNPTNDEPYYLNVSSVGLDKPLKNDKDFSRCLNKSVDVKLFSEINSKKQYFGTINSFNGDTLFINSESNIVEIPRKNIAVCKLHIEF